MYLSSIKIYLVTCDLYIYDRSISITSLRRVLPWQGHVGQPLQRTVPQGIIRSPEGLPLTFKCFTEHGPLPEWRLGETFGDHYTYSTHILISFGTHIIHRYVFTKASLSWAELFLVIERSEIQGGSRVFGARGPDLACVWGGHDVG